MAHEIDFSKGKAAIAFVGQTPWHGLGQQLTPGQGIEIWRKEAGLDYDVKRAPVRYQQQLGDLDPIDLQFKGRDVLYRSDTGKALSVVGDRYNIVQPSEILDFFAKLSEIGGFDLEVAGALSDGKRVWGLAKVNDGAPIIGHDVVRPYVLFATSYDASMSSVAKLTGIRVVCNNTIEMAVGSGYMGIGKTESDTENNAVSTLIRIPHSQKINADEIRLKLGIVGDVFEKWLVNTRLLAERAMTEQQAEAFTYKLVESVTPAPSANRRPVDVKQTVAYKRIIEMFNGDLIGADLTGGQNRWAMLNAVTQYVDHERGKTNSSRVDGAWFGAGNALKNKAYSLLSEV